MARGLARRRRGSNKGGKGTLRPAKKPGPKKGSGGGRRAGVRITRRRA